jgi:hypothetical protein
MPSLPEPIDLRVERPLEAPGARERHPWLTRRGVRGLLDGWLARRARPRRRRAATTLTDLWNAWAFAELECAIALRAWQLAPRRDKQRPYEAYRGALEREAIVAGELRLRVAS